MDQAEKVSSTMQKMGRYRSSCAFVKYHPGLCSPFIHFVVVYIRYANSEDSHQTARRPSLSAYAYDTFSHGVTRISFSGESFGSRSIKYRTGCSVQPT